MYLAEGDGTPVELPVVTTCLCVYWQDAVGDSPVELLGVGQLPWSAFPEPTPLRARLDAVTVGQQARLLRFLMSFCAESRNRTLYQLLQHWNKRWISLLKNILHVNSNRLFRLWMRQDVKCFVTDRLEDNVGYLVWNSFMMNVSLFLELTLF